MNSIQSSSSLHVTLKAENIPVRLDHTSKILVLGAGTWGTSTVLHLARRGYRDVTLLDAYPVPSAISAGNDVNKIAGDGNKNDSYVDRTMRSAAMRGWRDDPVFSPYYHATGYIVAASTPLGLKHLRESEESQSPAFTHLTSAADFRKTMPSGILTGEFPDWEGYFKESGSGWVHARNAIISAAEEAARLGVKFITGPSGDVKSLIYLDGDVIGAKTTDGTSHFGDRVILSAGANADSLLDFKSQLRPTAWTLLHIKMTPAEAALFKDLPVLFNIEKGFFMEPDAEKHELKICDEHPGYCNWITQADGSRKSVPFARHQVPKESEERARDFLRDTMPQLAERPFCFARICWCADTPNRNFLIGPHPDAPSLVLAVGASGRGFMHIPAIGGFIVDAMEEKLDPQVREACRWRPETAVERDWEDTQGRFGGPNRVMDFGKVTEWTTIGEEER